MVLIEETPRGEERREEARRIKEEGEEKEKPKKSVRVESPRPQREDGGGPDQQEYELSLYVKVRPDEQGFPPNSL